MPAAAAGVVCDFDGTLAEIVADPRDARPARGAAAALGRLARRYPVVAVVSGRPVADLAGRIRVPGVILAGIHGLEERRGRRLRVAPEGEAARAAVERAAAALAERLRPFGGVEVERKGLSVAVHFRRAEDPPRALEEATPLVEREAAREGLRLLRGRLVLEAMPAGGGDKGSATTRLAAGGGLRALAVLGDDAGDLPAFAAARSLPVSVCVAVASAEAPPGLIEAADLAVEGPRGVVAVLRALSDR